MDGNKTRKDNPEGKQTMVFLLVAICIAGPSFLFGGFVVGYVAFLLLGFLFVTFFAGDKYRRVYFFLYLFLALCLLIGNLTYTGLNAPETAGKINDLPLIGSLLGKKSVKTGLAVLAGLLGAAGGLGLPFALLLFISAEWMLALRETHELELKLALKLLLFLALGIGEAYFLVENAKITMTKPKGPLSKYGKPVLVIIKPYNAVVLERSGEVTQIEGPGKVLMKRHERLKEIIDLLAQGQIFEWNALSKDKVPLTGKAFMGFRIESREQAKERGDRGDFETKNFSGVISGPYPVYRRTLYRAVYGTRPDKNWITQTIGAAQGAIGNTIRQYRLDEIFVVDEEERLSTQENILLEIIGKAKESVTGAALNWGVSVSGLNIIDIKMPEEVQEHFVELWKVKSQKEIKDIQVEGETQVLKKTIEARTKAFLQLEKAKSEALDVIINQMITGLLSTSLSPSAAARFITAVERLARNLVADDLESAPVIEMMEQLAAGQLKLLPPDEQKRLSDSE